MPTVRPRHSITETDDVTDALRDAARRWPEDRDHPGRLLVRLLHLGHRVLRTDADEETARRRAAIRAAAGTLTGAYPPGYLEDLRADWPG